MRNIPIVIATLAIFLQTHNVLNAQNKRDVGFQAGTTYYYGDFNKNQPLYQPSPAIGVIFRYNYNRYYSIRGSLSHGSLKGSYSGNEVLPSITKTSFDVSVTNLEAMIEFNFVEINPNNITHAKQVTPYINIGIGGALISDYITANIPFSAGIKYTPGKRHTLAFEWRFHKTFTDNVDSYNAPYINRKSIFHNNDWLSFMGIIYTYRLFDHGQLCPVYE